MRPKTEVLRDQIDDTEAVVAYWWQVAANNRDRNPAFAEKCRKNARLFERKAEALRMDLNDAEWEVELQGQEAFMRKLMLPDYRSVEGRQLVQASGIVGEVFNRQQAIHIAFLNAQHAREVMRPVGPQRAFVCGTDHIFA